MYSQFVCVRAMFMCVHTWSASNAYVGERTSAPRARPEGPMPPQEMVAPCVDAVSCTSVTISWSKPEWPVTQFTVQMRGQRSFGGFDSWTHACTCDG